MEHNSGRDAVALQELVKATQERCKELEQQIYVRVPIPFIGPGSVCIRLMYMYCTRCCMASRSHALQAQQKSADDIRADLQRACEQQVDAVRNRASQQAESHGRCKQLLPAALSQTVCDAFFSRVPHGCTELFPRQAQDDIGPTLETLIKAVVEDLWLAGSSSVTDTQHQQDAGATVQQKIGVELGKKFYNVALQVFQRARDAGLPCSEGQQGKQVGVLNIIADRRHLQSIDYLLCPPVLPVQVGTYETQRCTDRCTVHGRPRGLFP